jgi:hypothetical protein
MASVVFRYTAMLAWVADELGDGVKGLLERDA